jgi:hypothetical protein
MYSEAVVGRGSFKLLKVMKLHIMRESKVARTRFSSICLADVAELFR